MDRRTTSLTAALIVFLGVGCVPKAIHKRDINEAYKKGFSLAESECFELQTQLKGAFEQLNRDKAELLQELTVKNERLATLNQIDQEGKLRTGKAKKK